jgi:hypothetical protein
MNKFRLSIAAVVLAAGITAQAQAESERFDFDAFNPSFEDIIGLADPATVNGSQFAWFDMQILRYELDMAIRMSSMVVLPQGISREDYVDDLSDALAIVETIIGQGDRYVELNSNTPILSQLLGKIGDKSTIPQKNVDQNQNMFESGGGSIGIEP